MEEHGMRMTVEEMRKAYPDTCIGITDIEYDDRERVVSGDVKYTDKSEKDLLMMAVHHTGIMPYYTSTSDGVDADGAYSMGGFMAEVTLHSPSGECITLS